MLLCGLHYMTVYVESRFMHDFVIHNHEATVFLTTWHLGCVLEKQQHNKEPHDDYKSRQQQTQRLML